MGILDETSSIERLRFFDGQRLLASDLQGIEAFNREMRWLHNRSLHQPGIGKGFAVAGQRGDRVVQIGPGYALDALGREIVLTTGRTEPVPPVDSEPDGSSVFFDLTVSYPDDASLAEAETRQGICLPRGAVRLREEPLFCWVRLELGEDGSLHPVDPRLGRDVEQSLRIVLARVEVLQCRLKQPVSLAQRKSARPATQPYIACGRDTVVWSPWTPLHVPGGSGAVPFALTAEVDTTSGRFQTTPCYSARIDGERLLPLGTSPDTTQALVDVVTWIEAPSPDGFTLRASLSVQPLVKVTVDDFKDWAVVWMGVE